MAWGTGVCNTVQSARSDDVRNSWVSEDKSSESSYSGVLKMATGQSSLGSSGLGLQYCSQRCLAGTGGLCMYGESGLSGDRDIASTGGLVSPFPQVYPRVDCLRSRRRRCGPPVGRTRGTSPWCPPALTGLIATGRGVSIPTRPAKHHGGGSPLRLLLLPPSPHNAHALPPYTLLESPRGTDWGARRSTSSTSGTVRHPPLGRGTQPHGCGPLARKVLPTGRRLAGRPLELGP